jgi:acetyl-CoA synthetase
VAARARPEGIRADDVAEELGKSVSTAYNLLVSLCDEGVRRAPLRRPVPARARVREMVTSGTARRPTSCTTSRAWSRAAGAHAQALLPGRPARRRAARRARARRAGDGQAAGLGAHIADNAHALALGKVDARDGPPESSSATCRPGCGASAPTRSPIPTRCATSCARSPPRLRGRREEFGEDFCCIASAVSIPAGRLLAAIGISMTRRAFDDEHETLARTVVGVALAAGARAGGGSLQAVSAPTTSPDSRHLPKFRRFLIHPPTRA